MWASSSLVNKDRSVTASSKADWGLAAKLCKYNADWFKDRCEFFVIHGQKKQNKNPQNVCRLFFCKWMVLCSLLGGRKTTI